MSSVCSRDHAQQLQHCWQNQMTTLLTDGQHCNAHVHGMEHAYNNFHVSQCQQTLFCVMTEGE